MTRDTWGKARQGLRKRVGQNNFAAWIEPLEFYDLAGGVLTFRVQSHFIGDWIDRYFRDQIIQEVRAAGEEVARLAFQVGQTSRTTCAAPASDEIPRDTSNDSTKDMAVRAIPSPVLKGPQEADPRKGPSLSGAPLDERFTFETFVVGKPNELAFSACRRVAEGAMSAFNPLVMHGDVGLGKTHLMHAIAWEAQAREHAASVLYLSAEQFMYRFVQALRDKQMMDFKQIFRSVDVLIVDDFQFIAGKDSTQEEFFHTFNALVDMKKQVIIAADSPPGEIKGLQDRIVSRLQSGMVVDVHPTSYELRLGILQDKLGRFQADFAGAQLADGVLEMLAARITRSVRELEGALVRLLAHSSFLQREIDIELCHECLRDLLQTQQRRVTIDDILRRVAEHYNVRVTDLTGPRRLKIYAQPRQVAMYLSKELTERSLPEIGHKIGGRDHTTIIHGVRKITKMLNEDGHLADDVALLRRSLGGE